MAKKADFDLDEFRKVSLPTESEIMADWKGTNGQPVVSVLCNTYNQEMYIEDAIRGFLIQRTDFPFEVIINDDASTDTNADIIKDYANRYPSIIKPVLQGVNQYSQGKKPSVVGFQHAKGKYIAFCEGDDFWICRDKLCLEVEAASSSGCGLVFTSAVILKGEAVSRGAGKCQSESGVVSLKAVIFGGASFCPTPSLLVKREVMEILSREDWFLSAPVGDLHIQAFAAIERGAYYINVDTCVYRKFSVGSWSSSVGNVTKEEEFLAGQLKAIAGLSQYFSDVSYSLHDQMAANAYYFSAIKHLRLKEFSRFKALMRKSHSLMIEKRKSYKVFYAFRNFPRLARFLAHYVVR